MTTSCYFGGFVIRNRHLVGAGLVEAQTAHIITDQAQRHATFMRRRQHRPAVEKIRRTMTQPQVCVTALREHRKQQHEERLKAGDRWVDSGLVFTTYRTCKEGKGRRMKVGAALHPRNVVRTLRALLDAAKLPPMRFHDLRHSAASLLIAEGIELAEVSMLLGHSELRVTADLYSHLQHQTAARAAERMDALFRG